MQLPKQNLFLRAEIKMVSNALERVMAIQFRVDFLLKMIN